MIKFYFHRCAFEYDNEKNWEQIADPDMQLKTFFMCTNNRQCSGFNDEEVQIDSLSSNSWGFIKRKI